MIQVVMPDWINPRGRLALDAFARGLYHLGLGYRVVTLKEARPSNDPMVCWGVFKTKLQERSRIEVIQQAQKLMGGELVIIERGFIKREDYYMVGFNKINGCANYPHDNTTVGHDRWKALGVRLQPWNESGEDILVIGQVPWDTTCQHVDHTLWVHRICKALRKIRPNQRIVFRPHPLQPHAVKCPDIDAMDRGLLRPALKKACVVITFSSTVGVDATLAGVPVVACDPMSMVFNLCANSLDEKVRCPERRDWANWIAYCQWTLQEMEQGLPWGHLHEVA